MSTKLEANREHANTAPRSAGHFCWVYPLEGGPVEIFLGIDGNYHQAPESNVIDLDTGNRHGRWLGSRAYLDNAVLPAYDDEQVLYQPDEG